jgi:hypothetical protein
LALSNKDLSSLSDEELLELEKLVDLNLKGLGCTGVDRTVSFREIYEARLPSQWSWMSAMLGPLGLYLLLGISLALAVYGLVRAIGWVIGGFAAS